MGVSQTRHRAFVVLKLRMYSPSHQAASAANIKPIGGVDLWLRNPDDEQAPDRMVLLVQNVLEQLVEARVVGQTLGLHPMVVILATTIGGIAAGLGAGKGKAGNFFTARQARWVGAKAGLFAGRIGREGRVDDRDRAPAVGQAAAGGIGTVACEKHALDDQLSLVQQAATDVRLAVSNGEIAQDDIAILRDLQHTTLIPATQRDACRLPQPVWDETVDRDLSGDRRQRCLEQDCLRIRERAGLSVETDDIRPVEPDV